ncbi:ABC transporter ATP-binding protein [Erysipelothrix sp. HDW6C]|uniref:ABC transporter ATP-binding protein n=1 Tax=Erysipelothrix sp. HDW6C TaxID=2714930 RepID=UPI00140C468F|nr:ABC transporter ATP-binding protein [Erysipelothrix sp. HDW6C]QIK69775.1 ABC transporter ATP-binding protein [Erysipelothrix sp. HDW6C]
MTRVLDVIDIEKYYGKRGNITKALDGVSFTVETGEFIGIMGPSGSGKTTLLNCVTSIDQVTSGHVRLGGVEITSLKREALQAFRRESLGFIFQDFNLLDTLTAYENIALPLTIQKVPHKEINQRVSEIVQRLDIADTLEKYPYQLSGGQQQRVASARALVGKPQLIVADEPTGSLDSKASRELLETLTSLNHVNQVTIMMVTHDAYSASYANRILFIKDGKLFSELYRGTQSRNQFFDQIMDVVTLLGGETDASR